MDTLRQVALDGHDVTHVVTEDAVGRRQTRQDRVLEARVGIEPAYTALQAAA